MSEDEMITFAQVERERGFKRVTLTKAAQRGELRATKTMTEIGVPVWKTTWEAIEEWNRSRKMGRPPKAR